MQPTAAQPYNAHLYTYIQYVVRLFAIVKHTHFANVNWMRKRAFAHRWDVLADADAHPKTPTDEPVESRSLNKRICANLFKFTAQSVLHIVSIVYVFVCIWTKYKKCLGG